MHFIQLAQKLEDAEHAAEGLWPTREDSWIVARHYAMGRVYVDAVDKATRVPLDDSEVDADRIAALRRVYECRFAQLVADAREQVEKRLAHRSHWPVSALVGVLFFQPPMNNKPNRSHDIAAIEESANRAFRLRHLEAVGSSDKYEVAVRDFLAWLTTAGEAEVENFLDGEHLQAYKCMLIAEERIPATPIKRTLSPKANARNRAILQSLYPKAALTCEEIHGRICEDPEYAGHKSAATTEKSLRGLERRGLVRTEHDAPGAYWLTDAGRNEAVR